MTTTTIPAATLVAPRTATTANRLGSLRAAFWIRLKGFTGPAFTRTTGFFRTVASRAASMIPAALGTLGLAVPLATRWGYGMATETLSGVGRLVRWAFRKGTAAVNVAIDWTGYRLGDLVGVFSPAGRAHVNGAVARFSTARDLAVGYSISVAERMGHTVMSAVRTTPVRVTVGATSAGVAALVALKMVLPTTFAGLLTMLPFAAGPVAAIAAGGAFPLAVIAGAAGVATLASLLGILAWNRTTYGKAGKTFTQARTEIESEIAADEALLAAVRADEAWMAQYEISVLAAREAAGVTDQPAMASVVAAEVPDSGGTERERKEAADALVRGLRESSRGPKGHGKGGR